MRPVGPGWLVDAAHDVSALGGPAVLTLAVLAVTGYLALLRQWRTVVLLVVAALGGLALSTLLKHLYARPRPAVVPYLAPVVTASFPSGHSMLAAVVYLTLGALLAAVVRQRRARAYVLTVALGLTFLVGVSRVYLGVHYPTDVLAGWSAGLAWAFSCWLVARWLQRRNRIEQSGSGS